NVPGVQIALLNAHTQNAFNNGSVLVRGGAAWETAQLIDGHALPLNAAGRFVSSSWDGSFFRDVEITKGPGAITPVVSNAINGTVNYRLREPAPRLQGRFSELYDGWGGLSTEAYLSGPLSKKLGFVVAFGAQGSNGYNGGTSYENFLPGANYRIDGRAIAASPYKPGSYPAYIINPLPFGSTTLESHGAKVIGAYGEHTGLARLRYRLGEATDATVTAFANAFGAQYAQPYSVATTFAPGTAYGAGPGPAAGSTNANLFLNYPRYDWRGNFQLYELDLRTRHKNDTRLARYYTMTYTDELAIPSDAPDLSFTAPFQLWGTASVCPVGVAVVGGKCGTAMIDPTVTVFHGETVRLTTPNVAFSGFEVDKLRGGSLEWDRTFGPHTATLSVDETVQGSFLSYLQALNAKLVRTAYYPAGTSFATTSVLARLQLNPSDRLFVGPALYYNVYSWRTSPDGGTTWQVASLTHLDPRLTVTYRPSADSSLRFAAGASIAPPYVSALANGTPAAHLFGNGGSLGPIYFTNSANPNLRAETAFGYDAGADVRLRDRQTILSVDVYRTTVSNQIFTQYLPSGTYDDGTNGTHPFYLITPANIARARDDGVELSIRRNPPRGFGFVIQGSVQRSFPYDLPASLYGLPGQPPNANLTIVPNMNFQRGVGLGGGTPYSQGYAELSVRGAKGSFASLGATFVGRNNTYAAPAFIVLNGTIRFSPAKNVSVQFAGDNLTNYNAGYPTPFFGSYALNTNLVTITGKQMVVPAQVQGPRTIRTSVSYAL
ncbi:MAG: TonB-dependent receptor, partial [Elusimicrobia bacterium]|nr:TonB-dependent receptor [Elusimicrobiota bacterium]